MPVHEPPLVPVMYAFKLTSPALVHREGGAVHAGFPDGITVNVRDADCDPQIPLATTEYTVDEVGLTEMVAVEG